MDTRAPTRARDAVRSLSPGYFAVVMATGVISVGMHLQGRTWISTVLLWVAAGAFCLLVGLNAWRLLDDRDRVLRDFRDPDQAFGFFTVVAGSGVLGTRLLMAGHDGWALGLFVVAGVGWLVLGYAIPWATMLHHGGRPTVATANGTWFMCVVASQSVAVLAAALEPSYAQAHHGLAVLSVVAWSVGVFLYVAEGMFVVLREMMYEVDFTPSYWVAMGAASITVLAGARIVMSGSSPVVDAVRELVGGVGLMFWAFATWLIPILTAALWWRHRVQRVPVAYDPTLWSMVFPLGMYAVAGLHLAEAEDLPWVGVIGGVELWVAFAAWVLVFAAMCWHVYRTVLSPGAAPEPQRGSGPGR